MFYTTFDDFIDPSLREESKPLLPGDKAKDIEEMNEWVYHTINNGVYKCGFASSQEAYDTNINVLFESLDRVESHLAATQTPYLFGDHVTEADIRLYPSIIRFDAAYFTLFKCNLKMVRYDYPHLHNWLRRLYWDTSEATNGGAFQKTTHFVPIKEGYTYSVKQVVVPAGPLEPILPLD